MTPYIRIQYASGIARALKEKRGRYCDLIHPVAPYLALCGNIISPHNKNIAIPFFEWAVANYDVVWWVPGHEEVASPTHSVTENIKEMYDLVNNNLLRNIHIANKLSKTYDGFKVIGVSKPAIIHENAVNLSHETGKPYTLDDVERISFRDQCWLEKELAMHNLSKYYAPIQIKDNAILLTNGYVDTKIHYTASIVGDFPGNVTGIQSAANMKKSWFGVNNWEKPGFLKDKFIELS